MKANHWTYSKEGTWDCDIKSHPALFEIWHCPSCKKAYKGFDIWGNNSSIENWFYGKCTCGITLRFTHIAY
jgi:hypothetical protein